jgi:hypothetical protein
MQVRMPVVAAFGFFCLFMRTFAHGPILYDLAHA